MSSPLPHLVLSSPHLICVLCSDVPYMWCIVLYRLCFVWIRNLLTFLLALFLFAVEATSMWSDVTNPDISRVIHYKSYFMVLHVLHGTSCNPTGHYDGVEGLVFWVMVGALYNRTHNNWVKWSTNLIIQCISAVPCDLGRVCLGLGIGMSSEVMTT